MTAFGIPDADAGGNGLVLTRDDRLEALEWALRQAETWSEVNDIRYAAPYRALTKHAGPAAERAAQMMRARWQQIDARDRALEAARRSRDNGTMREML